MPKCRKWADFLCCLRHAKGERKGSYETGREKAYRMGGQGPEAAHYPVRKNGKPEAKLIQTRQRQMGLPKYRLKMLPIFHIIREYANLYVILTGKPV
jgi:hypothetical protein